jgi:hypothetical protein
MRTTLTLDEDVAHQLRERQRLSGASFKHQAELCSNDSDFSRFPDLRWSHPLR